MGLLKAIHCLCNQRDGGTTGLMEVVTLEQSLALNVQGKRSEVDYLHAFKANADAINLAGGYVGGSIAEMMVRIDPSLHRKYITCSANGVPILYVRLSKALYGM